MAAPLSIPSRVQAARNEDSVRRIVSEGPPLGKAVEALQSIGYKCVGGSEPEAAACTRPVSSFDPRFSCKENVELKTNSANGTIAPPAFGKIACDPATL